MNKIPASDIETPTGKGAGDENFPVGSFLLPRKLRPHVAIFYNLARATDDIADNGELTPEDKLSRLDRFEKALTGNVTGDPDLQKSYAVAQSSEDTGVPVRHSVDLIHAFKQDAVKLRYDDWDDLMGYCALSASPVGRFLLDLHGEDPAGYPSSDALCNALQVLNHLQDLRDDYRTLDRIYLPGDWMAEQGVTVGDLDADATSPGLRAVIDRCLDGCARLLEDARCLPVQLENRRLRMEASVIVRLADRLTVLLREGDPVAGRVELRKVDFLDCGVRGIVAGLLRI
ncbi:MAG: squalene synthase HpnC [Rhodospirillaceae bacterium]|nr:MAG: squalene synthase HpnC [Rhodospirillaceae bacterium]